MNVDKQNGNHSKSAFPQVVYDMRCIPLPYLYLNNNGFILFANKHISQIGGYALIDIFQQPIDDLVVEPLADQLFALSHLLESQPYGRLNQFRHKDGQTTPAQIKVLAQTNGNARIQGFHVFIIQLPTYDETAPRPDHEVNRSSELQKYLAEQTDFIKNYLYESKTALSTLKTSVYLLKHAPENTHHHALDQLTSSVEGLCNMVQDAADYLKGTLLDNILNARLLPLNHVIEELTEIYQWQFEARKIDFRVRLPIRDCYTIGDRTRMLQAITHLLENAYHYTEHGKITLTLHPDYDKSLVFILIQDTGIGIPDKEQPHIFDRFYRAQNAKYLIRNRTGLGLSITKQIIEQHNGEIEVYSRLNAGTSVLITLPLVI